MILKGGNIMAAAMGDPNASIPTPQPVHYRPMFAANGKALASSCITFMSKAAIKANVPDKLGLERRVEAVKGCRKVTKSDMIDRKSTRLNSSHVSQSRMPSSA